MAHKSYREFSAENWGLNDGSRTPTDDQLQLGAIMRIADATERMSANYISLQNNHDMYKRWYEQEKESCRHMERRIAALQGVITKMKKAKP